MSEAPPARAAARIIPALDVSTEAEVAHLLGLLAGQAHWAKVGLELYSACGAGVVQRVADAGLQVMLDLKFHDIPRTVDRAVAAQLTRPGVGLLTLHASGGRAMVAAAADAAHSATHPARVLAVTVLTSLADDEARTLYGTPARDTVLRLARLAHEAGADGVVASPLEAAAIRAAEGPDFLIVTPGIRPGGLGEGDDQRRVTTAGEAARTADYLVVGRPIVEAPDPRAAFVALAAEIAATEAAPTP